MSAEIAKSSPGSASAGRVAHDPFDAEYVRAIIEEAFGPIVRHYFRPRLLGAWRLPRRGPAILAPNHSGTSFPYDGMVLDTLLWERFGWRPQAKVRTVYEKQLSLTWWMRPFGLDDFWRRAGGIDLTFENFDRLLGRGDVVAYYPEGVPGIGKGFRRRYQLQPFHSSFVTLASRHSAPVHPIHVVNAEWVIPFNFTLRPVDALVQRLLNVPFLPLPGAVLAVTFPWSWWLALPARMVFVVGEPIDVREIARSEGVTDLDDLQPDAGRRVADRIRRTMQRELTRYVERYGRWPYQARSLRRSLRRAARAGQLARVLPTGWPAVFTRFARDRQGPVPRTRLQAWLRDWDLLAYYVPFGWPLLSALRKLRRPPCGYRGLSREQRTAREGSAVWYLSERPLPPRAEPWPGASAAGPAAGSAASRKPDDALS